MTTGHVFISYARADGEAFARQLFTMLEDKGLAAWIDKIGGIRAGEYWDQEIEDAIKICRALIFIMTPESVKSQNCHDEWAFALSLGRPVYPLMFITCMPPMRLSSRQWIDFRHNFEHGLGELLGRLSGTPSLETAATTPTSLLTDITNRLNGFGKEYPHWLVIPAGRRRIGIALEHEVELAEYLISETPITQAQYRVFAQDTGYRVPLKAPRGAEAYCWQESGRKVIPPRGKDDHPVVLVNTSDAEAYCAWLEQKYGLSLHVLLPSSEQWEVAARGDDGRPYPWGKGEPSPDLCNFNGEGTSPVYQYPDGRSFFQCFDMAGNVWEWTRSPSKDQRIVRGGSWQPEASIVTLRSGFSHTEKPDFIYDTIGFRVMMEFIDKIAI